MMGETGKHIIIFLTGVLVGGFVAYMACRKEPEKVEVTVYRDKPEEIKENSSTEISTGARTSENIGSPSPPIEQLNTEATTYHNLANVYTPIPAETKTREIYVITIDEYGEFDDYEKELLWLYQDGVVSDDEDRIIDRPEEFVGDCLKYIRDDVLYVRNTVLQIDYEICLSALTYEEEISRGPIRG